MASLDIVDEKNGQRPNIWQNNSRASPRNSSLHSEESKHSPFNSSKRRKDSATGFDFHTKKSRLSPTILSNYVLAICLMKNVAMRYAYPGSFSEDFVNQLGQI